MRLIISRGRKIGGNIATTNRTVKALLVAHDGASIVKFASRLQQLQTTEGSKWLHVGGLMLNTIRQKSRITPASRLLYTEAGIFDRILQ